MKTSSSTSSTNPFDHHNHPIHHAQSNIPIANNSYLKYTSSPTPQRNMNFYESNYNNHASPHHQNAYPNVSNVPQYPRNTNGNCMIPTYRYQSDVQKHENLINRPPIPSSPQLDRLRVNLEKPNFYERHQLPLEVQLKESHVTSSSNTSNENKNGKGKIHVQLLYPKPHQIINYCYCLSQITHI